MQAKALVAMSGGVDSSVAAALMIEQGHYCVGVTFKLYTDPNDCTAIQPQGDHWADKMTQGACCSPRDISDAKTVAARLGMPHYVLDLTKEFETEVIRRFVQTYEQGGTPNPCIDCNRYVKFNLHLLRTALDDFDLLVTGHYARVERDPVGGRFLLRKSRDEKKDQTYVLYCLSQKELERTRFPLGEFSKDQVRKMAGDKNFVNNAKADSQDICFVPDGNYGDFIEAYTGKNWPHGDIVDLQGKVLGKHKGIIRYTIGQRRGLGVAANVPLYVAGKSIPDNTVSLGPDDSLYRKSLVARGINLVACDRLGGSMRVTAKTRYLQQEQPALVEQIGDDELHVEFDTPQRAITSGQAVVLYDGDIVVGGGTIV
ncbi:MAG: tRNA 2-thiouridine(34) synthase MnmA [Treponema sp.]|nr:tRNA 2-thiouridine(34) synthase MnmA [Treponema sp.]